MQVGLSLAFNNPGDERPDAEVWTDELRLVDLAEPRGFDSLWVGEHHFTGYCVLPDALQLLSYAAARTTTLQLGTMVVVLPWHDPVRVTEQVISLDILSGGRTLLGVGRGIAEIEFSGLGIPMEESRTRFLEIADILFGGLETGWVASDGLHFQQPSRRLRPRPLRSFKGRAYCAAMSPESIGMVADLGLNLMIVAQKPWDATIADVERYRSAFTARHGVLAPAPSVHVVTFCDPDRDRAHELGRQYMRTWYASSIDHYNLTGSQFENVAGYDHYARMSDRLNRYGEGAKDFLVDLQVCGTPDDCIDQIRSIQSMLGSDHYVATLSFGGMSGKESVRNVECFATQVLPALKELDPVPVEA